MGRLGSSAAGGADDAIGGGRRFGRLVLTGAAGRLGSRLREPLAAMCEELVSSDIVGGIDPLLPNERYARADLADLAEIEPVLAGADRVLHFGAFVDEAPFERLLGPNFIGAYNVWEGAFRGGVPRVIYASSIHAVGMYRRNELIGTDVPHRPDGFYGLAKCFAEDLARMYWDKRGVEAVCLRILSCAQVTSTRALGTWLSYDDLVRLVTRALDAPVTGFTVVYGVSDNDRVPVDNRAASYLGYRPRDNAESEAARLLAEETPPADPRDPAHFRHGGPFAATPIGESGLASMTIVDERPKREGADDQ